MIPDFIKECAVERAMSERDAAQVFFQTIVLKHLVDKEARFMGGTALVMAYGNPRFSEDVDFTQVRDPKNLKLGLSRACKELGQWLGAEPKLVPPKAEGRTWRLVYPMRASETIQLHVDSQPYRAYTQNSIVISFPPLTPFVVNALLLEEILSAKILALVFQRTQIQEDIILKIGYLAEGLVRENA
jgi:predicted nucleotidyltransferase component of viral defense system